MAFLILPSLNVVCIYIYIYIYCIYIDVENWTKHTHQSHVEAVKRAAEATTSKARDEAESEVGVRYSELLRLPYLDIIRHNLLDPMHNLFLGTAKHTMEVWKNHGYINAEKVQMIQDTIDSFTLLPFSGRILSKIASGSGFTDLTTEQWKMWTLIYSPKSFITKPF